MIWLASFCFALAFELAKGFYIQPDPAAAQSFGLLGLLLLGWAHRPRSEFTSPKVWLGALAQTLLLALWILALQFLLLFAYERWLMGHALLQGAAPWVWSAAELLGYEATVNGDLVQIQTQQQLYAFRLGAEKFALPFVALWWLPAALACLLQSRTQGRGWLGVLSGILVISGLYSLLRMALVLGIFADYGRLDVFWQPYGLALQYLPLCGLLALWWPITAPLAALFLRLKKSELGYALVFSFWLLALVLLTSYRPDNGPATARVLLDDAHSDWAWTEVAFDKQAFNRQATYSYTNLVEHLQRYYSTQVNHDQALTPELLHDYDVVILKTPTKPYSAAEIEAVDAYVKAGGGLFLVGDHTNLFGMSTHLNPIAERFGLRFEYDDTFDLSSGQPSVLRNNLFSSHPIGLGLNGLQFETSCSVQAPWYADRVLVGYGLGSELVDYSHINFFGNMTADLQDRYGVFLQGAAVDYGRGRVSAFTDSTIFSNFSLFQEGRSELVIATIEYLKGDATPELKWSAAGLLLLGLLAIAWHLRGAAQASANQQAPHPTKMPWLSPSLRSSILVSALVLPLGFLAVKQMHSQAYLMPEPTAPVPALIFDRHFSQYLLPSMIDINNPQREKSFDAFFVATQRMGFVPRIRRDFVDALQENRPLIMINPVGPVYQSQVDGLTAYLQRGGQLLMMIDDKGPFHTLNALLSGVEIGVTPRLPNALTNPSDKAQTDSQLNIVGVQAVSLPPEFKADAGAVPEVYVSQVGEGRVVLLVGAQYLSQDRMGPVFNQPDKAEQALYLLQYHLFEEIFLAQTGSQQTSLVKAN